MILLPPPRMLHLGMVLSCVLALVACEERDPFEAAAEEMAAANEREITFYGRVVYEDGTPAEGAIVAIRWSHRDRNETGMRQHSSEVVRFGL